MEALAALLAGLLFAAFATSGVATLIELLRTRLPREVSLPRIDRFAAKHWPYAAFMWTAAVLGAYVWAWKMGPVADWSSAEQLSLLESALAAAGFGAGAVVLIATIRQISAASGRSQIELAIEKRPPTLQAPLSNTWHSGPVAVHRCNPDLQISLVNRGDAIADRWQTEILLPPWLVIADYPDPRDISPDRHTLTLVGDGPLFVNTFRSLPPLSLGVPVALATKLSIPDPCTIDVLVTTEHGQRRLQFPLRLELI